MSYWNEFPTSLRLDRRDSGMVYVEEAGGVHHLSGVSWRGSDLRVITDDRGVVFQPRPGSSSVVRMEISNQQATITTRPAHLGPLKSSTTGDKEVSKMFLTPTAKFLDQMPVPMKFADGRSRDRHVEWELNPTLPMELRRLYIPIEYAKHYEVVQVNVGHTSLLVGCEEIPARAFSRLGGSSVYPRVIMPGLGARVILRLYPGSNFADVDASRASVVLYARPMEVMP